ncbi:hypothetical protein D3C78_969930 [compost metagenome]
MADVEPVQVQRLGQALDLRAGHLHFRLAELGKVFRPDDAGEQAQHHEDHQQFEQGEAAVSPGAEGNASVHRYISLRALYL